MNDTPHVVFSGTGSYLPPRVLSNADLEEMVDTSDEWITTRTGISERRIVEPGTPASDLALEASSAALADAGLCADDMDIIVLATITPDHLLPSTACRLQSKLEASGCGAVDIVAACSGFLYGVSMAQGLIQSGQARHALVVGTECLSTITDYTDRASCILFGDGAGAAVLSASTEPQRGIIFTKLGADGSGGDSMLLPAGGSAMPTSQKTLDERLHYMKIRGREVYRFAVKTMSDLVAEALEVTGTRADELKLVIPHQVNRRILEAAAKRLDIPVEKFYMNIDRCGNTSAASVPIALDDARRDGLVETGDLIVLVAFGGGLTWAVTVLRW